MPVTGSSDALFVVGGDVPPAFVFVFPPGFIFVPAVFVAAFVFVAGVFVAFGVLVLEPVPVPAELLVVLVV